MNVFIRIINIILVMIGILAILFFIFFIIEIVKYKKALTATIQNTLHCGKDYCSSPIKDMEVTFQNNTDYDKKTVIYLAELIHRLAIGFTDNSLIEPPILQHELALYNSDNDPPLGMIWSHNDVCYIIFRGTLDIHDLIKDLLVTQSSYTYHKIVQDKFIYSTNSSYKCHKTLQDKLIYSTNSSVQVHNGFNSVYSNFREQLITTVKKINPKQILISGHSLGGAIATICGLDLQLFGYNVIVYTFASPRVGNDAFCELVKSSKLPLYRIINTCDIIPAFPLSVTPNFVEPNNPYMYRHCGELFHFTDNWKSDKNNHGMPIHINWLNKSN